MYVLRGGQGSCYLVPGTSYIVGRKPSCDIVVGTETPNTGVSREHGAVNVHVNGEILYTDKSQFGTFVNGTKVSKNNTVTLSPGSEVEFGRSGQIYTLRRTKVVYSNLSSDSKRRCVAALRELNIPFSRSWDPECNTLIMDKIQLTQTMVRAVSECAQILLPSFLSGLVACVTSRTKLPNSAYQCPDLDPSLRNAKLHPNPTRQTLLEHLSVVFLDQTDYEARRELVERMGGGPVLWEEGDEEVFRRQTSIVVRGKRDCERSRIAAEVLRERGILPARDSDLILALLYCDKSKLFRRIRSEGGEEPSQSVSIAPSETQTTSRTESQIETQALFGATQGDQTQSLVENDSLCLPVKRAKHATSRIPAQVTPARDDAPIKLEDTSFDEKPPRDISQRSSPGKQHSFVEPSVLPPRLDKSISPATSTKTSKSSISFIEATVQPPRLDKTLNSTVNTSVKDPSFFEPTIQPPRLDKTLNSTVNTSVKDPSFFEPTVQPPRLDKTLNSSITTPGKAPSFFEPTVQPPRLDKTLETSTNTPGKAPSFFEPTVQPPRLDKTIPSPASSRPSPATQGSASLFGSSTRTPHFPPSRPVKRLLDDSDEDSDEDYNPFAASCRPLNLPSLAESLSSTLAAKRARLGEPEPPPEPVETKPEIPVKPDTPVNSIPVNPGATVPEEKGEEEEDSKPFVSPPATDPSQPNPTPRVKRELSEPSTPEPFMKKMKLEESIKILTIGEPGSRWITNEWVRSKPSNSTTTTVSPALLVRNPRVEPSGGLVNYKRFKRKDVPVRSMNITLSVGSFRRSGQSRLGFRDSDPEDNLDDEEDSFNPFFAQATNKPKPKRTQTSLFGRSLR